MERNRLKAQEYDEEMLFYQTAGHYKADHYRRPLLRKGTLQELPGLDAYTYLPRTPRQFAHSITGEISDAKLVQDRYNSKHLRLLEDKAVSESVSSSSSEADGEVASVMH